jgi:hypothetical protein
VVVGVQKDQSTPEIAQVQCKPCRFLCNQLVTRKQLPLGTQRKRRISDSDSESTVTGDRHNLNSESALSAGN